MSCFPIKNEGMAEVVDNVSNISVKMADALCRLSTGAGISKKKHYADTEETLIAAYKPVLITSIENVLLRADLADRAFCVTVPPIAEEKRRTEGEVIADFEAAAPGILAALLDGVVKALHRLLTVKVSGLLRMADFSRIAVAAAPAFGWTDEQMEAALKTHRMEADQGVLDADPLAMAILSLVANSSSDTFSGEAADILERLNKTVPEDTRRERTWPKGAAQFSKRLNGIVGLLGRHGVKVTRTRTPGARTITLSQSRVGASGRAYPEVEARVQESGQIFGGKLGSTITVVPVVGTSVFCGSASVIKAGAVISQAKDVRGSAIQGTTKNQSLGWRSRDPFIQSNDGMTVMTLFEPNFYRATQAGGRTFASGCPGAAAPTGMARQADN